MTDAPRPRYEFRVFAADLTAAAHRIAERADSAMVTREASAEIYVVSRLTIDANLKIRHDRLELKILEAREGLFELWRPAFSAELPVETGAFMSRVAPYLGVSIERPRRGSLCDDDILALCEIVPALAAVFVRKVRTQITMEMGMMEFVELAIDGSRLHSIAVESERLESAASLLDEAGIGDLDNESYPAYLQRIVFG